MKKAERKREKTTNFPGKEETNCKEKTEKTDDGGNEDTWKIVQHNP